MYLSPYVEEPLNSKVIKSFVPELSSRKCFSCFVIPMFYEYIYEHYRSISHVAISWLWYTIFCEDVYLDFFFAQGPIECDLF